MNVDLGLLPPESNKPKTNNSNGGGWGATSSSKKKTNIESTAIVNQISTDQCGKAKLTPNSDSLAVSKKTNFKKRKNVESSGRRKKVKGKLKASAPNSIKENEKRKG